MGVAGDFPLTVMIQSVALGNADSLGHKAKTYTDVRKCGARRWTKSAAELSFQVAEFPQSTTRLLLRLPPRDLAVGMGIVFDLKAYEIIDLDWRDSDQDCLVTIALRV